MIGERVSAHCAGFPNDMLEKLPEFEKALPESRKVHAGRMSFAVSGRPPRLRCSMALLLRRTTRAATHAAANTNGTCQSGIQQIRQRP